MNNKNYIDQIQVGEIEYYKSIKDYFDNSTNICEFGMAGRPDSYISLDEQQKDINRPKICNNTLFLQDEYIAINEFSYGNEIYFSYPLLNINLSNYITNKIFAYDKFWQLSINGIKSQNNINETLTLEHNCIIYIKKVDVNNEMEYCLFSYTISDGEQVLNYYTDVTNLLKSSTTKFDANIEIGLCAKEQIIKTYDKYETFKHKCIGKINLYNINYKFRQWFNVYSQTIVYNIYVINIDSKFTDFNKLIFGKQLQNYGDAIIYDKSLDNLNTTIDNNKIIENYTVVQHYVDTSVYIHMNENGTFDKKIQGAYIIENCYISKVLPISENIISIKKPFILTKLYLKKINNENKYDNYIFDTSTFGENIYNELSIKYDDINILSEIKNNDPNKNILQCFFTNKYTGITYWLGNIDNENNVITWRIINKNTKNKYHNFILDCKDDFDINTTFTNQTKMQIFTQNQLNGEESFEIIIIPYKDFNINDYSTNYNRKIVYQNTLCYEKLKNVKNDEFDLIKFNYKCNHIYHNNINLTLPDLPENVEVYIDNNANCEIIINDKSYYIGKYSIKPLSIQTFNFTAWEDVILQIYGIKDGNKNDNLLLYNDNIYEKKSIDIELAYYKNGYYIQIQSL